MHIYIYNIFYLIVSFNSAKGLQILIVIMQHQSCMLALVMHIVLDINNGIFMAKWMLMALLVCPKMDLK